MEPAENRFIVSSKPGFSQIISRCNRCGQNWLGIAFGVLRFRESNLTTQRISLEYNKAFLTLSLLLAEQAIRCPHALPVFGKQTTQGLVRIGSFPDCLCQFIGLQTFVG